MIYSPLLFNVFRLVNSKQLVNNSHYKQLKVLVVAKQRFKNLTASLDFKGRGLSLRSWGNTLDEDHIHSSFI